MGDTADNIPGVPGIGEKTATALIGQYGCIEEVHAHADVVKPPRASKNIVEYWDQAVMSKELATIIQMFRWIMICQCKDRRKGFSVYRGSLFAV